MTRSFAVLPNTPCRAKDKENCAYHNAVKDMASAIQRGDFFAYENARRQAERHVGEAEKMGPLAAFFGPDQSAVKRTRRHELNDLAGQVDSARAIKKAKQQARPKVKPEQIALPGSTDGYLYPLVPNTAETGTRCYDCKHWYTRREVFDGLESGTELLTCPVCNNTTPTGVGEIWLTQEAVKNFDPAHTAAASWWHATTDPDWAAKVWAAADPPMIHAGTKLAAWMRAKAGAQPGQQVFLHELKVAPATPVAPAVYEDDMGDWDNPGSHPKTVGDIKAAKNPAHAKYDPAAVSRYVNSYEDTGSVSIMGAPATLRVVGSRSFDLTVEPVEA